MKENNVLGATSGDFSGRSNGHTVVELADRDSVEQEPLSKFLMQVILLWIKQLLSVL